MALVGCAVATVGLLLLVPVRYPGRILGVAFDLAHLPVFALLVIVSSRLLGGRRPAALLVLGISLVATLLGVLGELGQSLSGRSAGSADAAANAVGAGLGFLVMTRTQWPRREFLAAALVMAAAVLACTAGPALALLDIARQHQQYPVLASFENDLELSRWEVVSGSFRRTREHATLGSHALRWDLQPARYPTLIMRWPPNDWSPCDALELDVWLQHPTSLPLEVKIEDFDSDGSHADRFQTTPTLNPGLNTIRISLSAIRQGPSGRELDLTRITRLSLFTIGPEAPITMFVDRVALVRR